MDVEDTYTDRQIDRQIDRYQMDRQIDRQIDRQQIDRQIDIRQIVDVYIKLDWLAIRWFDK